MAGVKGRSGRKKAPFQEQRARVIDKAWQLIEDSLNDTTIEIGRRLDIAKGIVIKNMPTELTGAGGKDLYVPPVINIIGLEPDEQDTTDSFSSGSSSTENRITDICEQKAV